MSDPDRPVVLAVDDEEDILGTYELWLADDYELRTATDGESAMDALDDEVDVVLLDRMMPGVSGDDLLDRIRSAGHDCRVAMVTAVEPDYDIVDMPFDAYVEKALDRETIRETVERLLDRQAYDDVAREHFALASKLASLEASKTPGELEDSEEYRRLTERFEETERRLERRGESLDDADFVAEVSALDRSTGGEDA